MCLRSSVTAVLCQIWLGLFKGVGQRLLPQIENLVKNAVSVSIYPLIRENLHTSRPDEIRHATIHHWFIPLW